MGSGVTQLWEGLPTGRVVQLTGASPAALALTLTPLPDDAPAVVTWRPTDAGSPSAVVAAALAELETAAVALFPTWLPDADGIDSPGGSAVAAVRALALRLGSTTPHFGPYLADLAERGLRQAAPPAGGRFSPEVRAAGVARVLAESLARPTAALLVEVPHGLDRDGEHALVGGCEWLAWRGGFGVWLTGEPLPSVDWLATVPVVLPEHVAHLVPDVPPAGEPAPAAVWFPPPPGIPHPASHAEQALERALAQQPWTHGRAWNQTYRSHLLASPVRLDLVWWSERCVVEIDGPEHRGALHYEADRRRDVQLQLDGFAVLRFTNRRVHDDLPVVVSQIERLVQTRRREPSEGRQHARQ